MIKMGNQKINNVKRFTAMISDELDKRIRDFVEKEYLGAHGKLSMFATKAFTEYLDKHQKKEE